MTPALILADVGHWGRTRSHHRERGPDSIGFKSLEDVRDFSRLKCSRGGRCSRPSSGQAPLARRSRAGRALERAARALGRHARTIQVEPSRPTTHAPRPSGTQRRRPNLHRSSRRAWPPPALRLLPPQRPPVYVCVPPCGMRGATTASDSPGRQGWSATAGRGAGRLPEHFARDALARARPPQGHVVRRSRRGPGPKGGGNKGGACHAASKARAPGWRLAHLDNPRQGPRARGACVREEGVNERRLHLVTPTFPSRLPPAMH